MTEVSEAALYDAGTVKITATRAVFGETVYPLANITSVAPVTIPPATGGQAIFFLGGVFALVIGLLVEDQRWLCLGSGAVLLLLGWVLYRNVQPTYAVKIGTAGAEQRVHTSSDKTEIEQIVAALNQAIDRRG